MLTPDFAFNQVITVERWIRRDINEDVYAAPETARCRVNFARKRTLVKSGSSTSEVIAAGTVFMPAGTRLAAMDRLTFDGQLYHALSVQPCYDWLGKENHVEVVIQ